MKTKQEIIDSHTAIHPDKLYDEDTIHKMLDEYMREYLEAVVMMRRHQKVFFRSDPRSTARQDALKYSKMYEKIVDEMSDMMQNKSGEQKEMF